MRVPTQSRSKSERTNLASAWTVPAQVVGTVDVVSPVLAIHLALSPIDVIAEVSKSIVALKAAGHDVAGCVEAPMRNTQPLAQLRRGR